MMQWPSWLSMLNPGVEFGQHLLGAKVDSSVNDPDRSGLCTRTDSSAGFHPVAGDVDEVVDQQWSLSTHW